MRMDSTTYDLGDDVIYAIGRSGTLTLLVLNNRPVSRLNRERAQRARKDSRDLRAWSAALRRERDQR